MPFIQIDDGTAINTEAVSMIERRKDNRMNVYLSGKQEYLVITEEQSKILVRHINILPMSGIEKP